MDIGNPQSMNAAAAASAAGQMLNGGGRWSARIASDIVALIDVAAVLLAGCIDWQLHGLAGAAPSGGTLATVELAFLCAAVVHFVLHELNDYDGARMAAFPAHPGQIALAVSIAFSVVISVAYSFGATESYPRSWFPAWLAIAVMLITVVRFAARRFLARYAKAGYFDTSLAVYGGGRIARKLMEHITAGGSGVRLVGVYDDRQDPSRADWQDLPYVGGLTDLIQAGRDGLIDQIVIALPQSADQRIAQIARRLEQLPVRISVCTHIASDLIDAETVRHRVSSLGPVGLLETKRKPLADWGPVVKRILDAVIAAIALAAFAPVFAAAAIAIKLDSPGPVLFRQKRHGLNHRVIEVLKFRTMRVMEEGTEVKQAQKNDARVTRVGRLLRKTSLDELPQLVNILKGEMSLVGPRPHALVHNEYYGEMLERYANRHQVKPGLTGWAQVNGFRGETERTELMQKRVEYDLHYINNWSIWLDLRILFVTPVYGFTHKNAY